MIKKTVSLIIALAIGLAGVISVVPPAYASDTTPDRPSIPDVQALSQQLASASDTKRAELFEDLSPEEQGSLIKFNTITRVEEVTVAIPNTVFSRQANYGLPPSTAVVTASSCKTEYNSRRAYNYLGLLIWEYWSRVECCYNGSLVTSKFPTHGANIPSYSMWRWIRDTLISEAGGNWQSYYRRYVSAEFGWDLMGQRIETAWPWVDITVRGDGTSSSRSGG